MWNLSKTQFGIHPENPCGFPPRTYLLTSIGNPPGTSSGIYARFPATILADYFEISEDVHSEILLDFAHGNSLITISNSL